MQRLSLGLTLLLSCLISTACVSSGDGEMMQKDIAQLQAETQALAERAKRAEDELASSKSEVEELNKLLESARRLLSGNNADLLAQVLEVRSAVGKIQGEHDVLKRKIDALDKDYELFKNDVANRLSGGSTVELPDDPDGLIELANQLMADGKMKDARVAFQTFARDFPKDARAARARFNVGETYLREGKTLDAFEEYRTVLKTFPKSDVADAATFRVGDVFVMRGECDKAEVFYSEVVSKFKKSDYRKQARAKIKDIQRGKLCK
jgi:TolA-binding protein